MTMASSRLNKQRRCVCCALRVEVVLLVSAFFAAGPVEGVNVQHHSRHRQENQQEQHHPQQQQHQKKELQTGKEDSFSFLHKLNAKGLAPRRQQQQQVRVHSTPSGYTTNRVAYEEDSAKGGGRFSDGPSTSFFIASLKDKDALLNKVGTTYSQHQSRNDKETETSASSAAVRQSQSFRFAGPHRQDAGGNSRLVAKVEERLSGEGRTDQPLSRSGSSSSSGLHNVFAFPAPAFHDGRAARATSAKSELFIEAAAGSEGAGEEAGASPGVAHAQTALKDAYATPAGTTAAIDHTHGGTAPARASAGVLAAAAPAILARTSANGAHLPATAPLPASSVASSDKEGLSLPREHISGSKVIFVENKPASRHQSVEAAASKRPTARHAVTATAFASVAAKGAIAPPDPVAASFSTAGGSAVPLAMPSTSSISSLSSAAAKMKDVPLSLAAPLAPAAPSAVSAEKLAAVPFLPYAKLQGSGAITPVGVLKLIDGGTPPAAAAEIPFSGGNAVRAGAGGEPSSNLSDLGLASQETSLPAFPAAGATPLTVLSGPVFGAGPPSNPLPTASLPPSPLPTGPAGTGEALPVPSLPDPASLPVASSSVPISPASGVITSSGDLTHDPPALSVPLPSTPVLNAAAPAAVAAPTTTTTDASRAPAAPAGPAGSVAPAVLPSGAASAAPTAPAVPALLPATPAPANPSPVGGLGAGGLALAAPAAPATPAGPAAPAAPAGPPTPAGPVAPANPAAPASGAAPAPEAAPATAPEAASAAASDAAPAAAPDAAPAAAPEASPAPAAQPSDDDAAGTTVHDAADAAARAVTHDTARVDADPTNASPSPHKTAPVATAAAGKEVTIESASPEYRAPREHKYGEACFDACSCWPVWSLGILLMVLNLTASFVAFYHTANLFSRGLLSSQFYRGGGYWLLGVATLGFLTGGLIGVLVPPSCWAGALYLGGFLMSLFLSFVLIGRRGALLGSFGGVGAGGVIGFFTQTGSLGIVIGMVLGLLFGIVIGFAPICRGLKINERYVRASLGAERRLRRGRYTEDHYEKGEKSPSAVSPNLRSRYTGSSRESPTSTPHPSQDYILPPLESSPVTAASSATGETTASVNSASAEAVSKDATSVDLQQDVKDSGPLTVDHSHDAA